MNENIENSKDQEMKVTIENKKGLNKDIKVFVGKKLITSQMEDKYEELKKSVTLKGFRPAKYQKIY